jgi:hypothetical protein
MVRIPSGTYYLAKRRTLLSGRCSVVTDYQGGLFRIPVSAG